MNIEGSTALVTGANRGLGKAFAEALLRAGARKVYAAARDPSSIKDPKLTPIQLDLTSRKDIKAAVEACGDVSIHLNNDIASAASGKPGHYLCRFPHSRRSLQPGCPALGSVAELDVSD